VVVTYHPDGGFADRIRRVARQVGTVVIVDNGSSEAETGRLRELAADPGIMLQLNAHNLGVATALNIGVQRAIDLGFGWVLLLDQDSYVNEDIVDELLAARNAYPDHESLAVIGSSFWDVNKEAPAEQRCPVDTLWEEVSNVITSGSLIPLAAHAVVGPFRDEFFIDHVDMEYCCRARAKGLRVIKTRKPLMSHAIGAYSQHRLLWAKKWTTNHSPDRRYYISRNDTVMLREYGNYPLGLWWLKSLRRRIQLCKRILLYEDRKAAKLVAVAQGWWDGVLGNMGPRNDRRRKADKAPSG
jgi:rhamnosyltransferase